MLNLAVASLLYERLAQLPEGDLSRVRANLVKQDTLHQLALRLKVSEVLRLGEGESKSGGQQRPSILADALEALIGAVYLDAGYEQAEALVHRLFQEVEINPRHAGCGQGSQDGFAGMVAGPQNEAAAVPRGGHRGRSPSPDL